MDFTYTNFAIDNVFTLLQPIFRTIFIFSVIFLAIVIAKVIPTWIVVLYGVFSTVITGQLFWYSSIIVDELNLASNPSSMTLFIATCVTNIISILASLTKKPKKEVA